MPIGLLARIVKFKAAIKIFRDCLISSLYIKKCYRCQSREGSKLGKLFTSTALPRRNSMNRNPDFSDLFKNPAALAMCKAGDVIFATGQPGNCMYLVKSGEVQIKRGEKLLETVQTGGVFGEMALIDGAPRSASAIARTDCVLMLIDETRFFFLVELKPSFALHVIKTLSRRLRTTIDAHKYRAWGTQFLLNNPVPRREPPETKPGIEPRVIN
jgi:CRP/FNR family cyclic AMP-dependent transcriptional regulator